MARYIDSDLYKKVVMAHANERESSIAMKLVDRVPTAKVAEIRTGKWIVSKASNALNGHVRTCNACKYTIVEQDENTCSEWNYCPKCGIEMEN